MEQNAKMLNYDGLYLDTTLEKPDFDGRVSVTIVNTSWYTHHIDQGTDYY